MNHKQFWKLRPKIQLIMNKGYLNEYQPKVLPRGRAISGFRQVHINRSNTISIDIKN